MPQKPIGQIDYDALAAASNGTVVPGVSPDIDYDALAHAQGGQAIHVSGTPAAPPRPRDAVGFMRNVATSGGQFAKDTAIGAVTLVKLAYRLHEAQDDPQKAQELGRDFLKLIKQSPQIGANIVQALKGRYGSPDAVVNTLYSDPVGVLADVATVAGTIATGGAAGEALAARAGIQGAETLGRIADIAGTVERVTNPLTLPGKAAKTALNAVGTVPIRVTVRPSAPVAREFGTTRQGVARAIQHQRVTSAAQAESRLQSANQRAQEIMQAAEQAGAKPIPVSEITAALEAGENSPMAIAQRRAKLGHPDAVKQVEDFRSNIIAGQPSGSYTLAEADPLKREAQSIAFEAGRDNASVSKKMQEAIAQAFKKAIEERAPEIGPVNQTRRDLMAAKAALSEAEDRPNALNRTAELALAGTGHLPVAAALHALQSPRLGAGLATAFGVAGDVAASPAAHQAALINRGFNDALLQLMVQRSLEQEPQ